MFRLDLDRMYVIWTVGDKDLAFAFVEMEGFKLAPNTIAYRCSQGYEQRITYKTVKKDIERERELKRKSLFNCTIRSFDN